MVNPLKMMRDVVPALKDVLESIHAHLELILDEDKKINQHLETTNEKLTEVISILNEKNKGSD